MAITGPTLVQNFYDNDNLGTYSGNVVDASTSGGATFQLVAGRHYFVVIESSSSGAAETVNSVVFDPTGTPLSFSQVDDGVTPAVLTGFGVTGNTFQVWHRHVSSTTATSFLRVIFAGTQSACGWGLFYIEGENDTGTIVQVKTATGASTTPGVTMNAFGGTNNLLLLCVCRDDIAGGFTVTEGRSELYENQENERNWSTTHYQNPHGSDTSVGCTLNVSDNWAAIGIEILAAEGATSDDVLIRLGSMGTTDGSGLVTADFTAGAAATVFGGGYLLRRRLLDAMTGLDDV